ncbi:hypothetical protein MKX03_004380 [Papaver bracteatum]|nr:hypothetical protein MKX03_004380 [Papaver bracteatum]
MRNLTSSVDVKFAFFPPDPQTYDVFRDGEGKVVFSGVSTDKNMEPHLLDTKGGNKIVFTFWKHPFARFNILYSHGNVANLGQMQELYIELRAHLRVNIMSYDYLGYRASYAKRDYGIKQEDIIMYGQSVGSGHTLHFASRLPRLRDVILHSAILSGIQVLYPTKVILWFDILKNIDKIRHVNFPVLVIHLLSELTKEKYDPLWIKGGGHYNLDTYPDFIKHLCKFMNAIKKLTIVKPPK